MKAAIVGIGGPELTAEEAALLREHRPAGVILFARNIETRRSSPPSPRRSPACCRRWP